MEPEHNKVYQVLFGDTWRDDASQNNFVKQSVDWTKEGVIRRAPNGFVSVEFKNAKGDHAAYLEGSFAAPKKPECLLIFDGEKFIIDKVGTTALGLVDVRRQHSSVAGGAGNHSEATTKRGRPDNTAADTEQVPPPAKKAAKDKYSTPAPASQPQPSAAASPASTAQSGLKIKFPSKASGKASGSPHATPHHHHHHHHQQHHASAAATAVATPPPAPPPSTAASSAMLTMIPSSIPPATASTGGGFSAASLTTPSPTSRKTRTSLAASSSNLAAAAGASDQQLDDAELLAIEQQMASDLGSSTIISQVPEGAMRSVFDESSSDSDESEDDSDDSDDD